MGDVDVRYIQELPIYNYFVVGVHRLIGHLDLSGKVTSILIWALSFVLLQFIWRRILNPKQAFWANLLFVVAPLSVFFGPGVHAGDARAGTGVCFHLARPTIRREPFSGALEPLCWHWAGRVASQVA